MPGRDLMVGGDIWDVESGSSNLPARAICRCVGMVDEAASKSVASDGVWVRVPPPAPKNGPLAQLVRAAGS